LQTIEQALFNNLPEQTKPGKSGFNLQAKAIDEWFDKLPMANIRIATKTIYKALKETNSYEVSYNKRLYFLEKIHEPVTELAANLKKLNLNREFPLDEKHQRIAILLQKLHRQVTMGYRLVLQDLVNCPIFFLCISKRKLMTLAIERIIRHNSLSLITNYQLYNAPQKGLWTEIHNLFLLAHEEDLLNKRVSDPSLQTVKETTIKNVYLQILLVAVADPYRMAQHHTYSIFKQLEEWSILAEIHKHHDEETQDCLVIDLSIDTHPALIAHKDTQNKSFSWTIDTSKLNYAHLIEHFDGPGIQTTEINAELLKQLSLAWGLAPSRQQNRRRTKSKLKVAIGLNNVHYVLNGNAEPVWMQSDESRNTDNSMNGLVLSENAPLTASFESQSIDTSVKVSDIWGEAFTNKPLDEKRDKKEQEKHDQKYHNELEEKNKELEAAQKWGMINESIGGYCLLWDNTDSVEANVGEVVAISHEEDRKEGYWFVGTIRWMKCVGNSKVQIGVQILAPNAIAVSIAKYVSMQEGMKSRAILLPAIPVLKQEKTLITTALGYDLRDQVVLDEYRLVNANITNVKSKVVLTDTLEISSHFSRFKYTPAEDFYGTTSKKEIPKETGKDTLSLDSDSEFDSIWDDL
jgi:cyclic-di-GMP-binding protein